MWESASRIDTPTVLEVLNFYSLPRGVIQFLPSLPGGGGGDAAEMVFQTMPDLPVV